MLGLANPNPKPKPEPKPKPDLGVGEQLHADPLAARLGCEAAVPELLIDRGQLPEAPGAVPLHVLLRVRVRARVRG